MALICPQCSQIKQDDTLFCRSCGYRFQGNEQTVDEGATIRPASLASVPGNADPSETLKPGYSPVSQPAPAMVTPQPQPQTPSAPPVHEQPAPGQSPFYSQPVPPIQGGYVPQQQPLMGQAPQQAMYGQQPPQGGYGMPAPVPSAPSGLATLQRGFAGKGTPVHHQSWLIENKQVAPQTLSSAFITNLQKQNVLGVIVEHERLREHGAVLEERDYVKVRYGASSIFVYFAPMGQNLYISRTSTIQQPYSKVRIAVTATLAVLALISLILGLVIGHSDPTVLLGVKEFFQLVFSGLLIFFIAVLLRSLVFLSTDNDFLAILRPNRLNDFSLDALSSIEQTTDKALRVTLQDAGLDADAIKLAHTTTPQQPLHRI